MELEPPAPQAEGHSLVDVAVAAAAWALKLVTRLCDAGSRRGLSQSSKGCLQLVWEAAERMAVTLLGYGGLSEAAWQRRLDSAVQALTARGQERGAKALVLRLPTPNPAALQSILSIPAAAGRAVSELVVRQVQSAGADYNVVQTPWLTALPAAFCHLRVLRIDRLRGKLPDPATLPHLKELCVHVPAWSRVVGKWYSTHEECASLAALLPQLTTLHYTTDENVVTTWWTLFTQADPRPHYEHLTCFETSYELTDELVGALRTRAPGLQRLRAGGCDHSKLTEQHSGATWGVQELGLPSYSPWDLFSLPQSTALVLLPNKRGLVELALHVSSSEGLSQAVLDLSQQLDHAAPYHITLCARIEGPVLQAGLQAALMQLSELPTGSRIETMVALAYEQVALDRWEAAVAAIGAAAPSLPHITIIPPRLPGTDESVGRLCELQPQLANVALSLSQTGSLSRYGISIGKGIQGAHKHVPWPWPRLCASSIDGTVLVLLPNPCAGGGPYQIEFTTLCINMEKWTPEMYTELAQRMQRWTFVVHDATVALQPPKKPERRWAYRPGSLCFAEPEPEDTQYQGRALRQVLQALAGSRWRCEPANNTQALTVRLDKWSVQRDVVEELGALPDAGFAARLQFDECTWPEGGADACTRLPSIVPRCYRVWAVLLNEHTVWEQRTFVGEVCTIAHIQAICVGAEQCQRELTLRLGYTPARLSDAERSQLESFIEDRALGRWVTVEWCSHG